MSNVEKLCNKLEELQEDGVVDIRIFKGNKNNTEETLAKGFLDLLEAETVEDPDFF